MNTAYSIERYIFRTFEWTYFVRNFRPGLISGGKDHVKA